MVIEWLWRPCDVGLPSAFGSITAVVLPFVDFGFVGNLVSSMGGDPRSTGLLYDLFAQAPSPPPPYICNGTVFFYHSRRGVSAIECGVGGGMESNSAPVWRSGGWHVDTCSLPLSRLSLAKRHVYMCTSVQHA